MEECPHTGSTYRKSGRQRICGRASDRWKNLHVELSHASEATAIIPTLKKNGSNAIGQGRKEGRVHSTAAEQKKLTGHWGQHQGVVEFCKKACECNVWCHHPDWIQRCWCSSSRLLSDSGHTGRWLAEQGRRGLVRTRHARINTPAAEDICRNCAREWVQVSVSTNTLILKNTT